MVLLALIVVAYVSVGLMVMVAGFCRGSKRRAWMRRIS